MINYYTLIFWWIAYTTKYYFLIAIIVKLNTRLGNRLVLVIFQVFWHLKFDSLYLSLAIYHLSCSSFVFLGIVIVKVCFFPGADFLLNKALVKKMLAIIIRRKTKNMENASPVNRVHVRSGTFPLLAGWIFHLGKSHRCPPSCGGSTARKNC